MKNTQIPPSSILPHSHQRRGKQHSQQQNSFFRCPFCQAKISPDHFEVFQSIPSGMLYIVQCWSCQHSLYGSFVLTSEGLNSIGILTDLTKDDILKFQHRKPITSDEVLVLYEMWERRSSK